MTKSCEEKVRSLSSDQLREWLRESFKFAYEQGRQAGRAEIKEGK